MDYVIIREDFDGNKLLSRHYLVDYYPDQEKQSWGPFDMAVRLEAGQATEVLADIIANNIASPSRFYMNPVK